jgi:hypothetical protein
MLILLMQKTMTNSLTRFVCGFCGGGRLCAGSFICTSGEAFFTPAW